MSSQSGTGQTAQFWIRDETWNHNVLQLVPSSTSGSPHLVFVYTPGYFQANYGFNASNSDFNAFRSTGGGGISVNCVRAAYYTHIGLAGSTPGMMTGDGLSYGCMYYNTADNTLKLYTNSGWKTVTVT